MEDRHLEEAEKVLLSVTSILREHFDSFQLFVTSRTSTGKTLTAAHSGGNYFTRYGQLREWLLKADERAKCEQRIAFEDEISQEVDEEDDDV